MNMRRAPAWPLLALLVLAAVFVWLTRPQPLRPSDLPVHKPDPANGELVFHAGGCASCHGERLEGGLELETPYGTFRMPNISPEAATGIGGWSTLEFVNAVVRGVAPDGRHYYPAFPYPSYARMALRDAIDLKAYIDTLEPVVASNGRHDLAFPWNIRRGVGLWKRRYVSPDPVFATDATDAVVERGRYLVEGVGHCGECHTPRDGFGGLDTSRWLGGGPSPEGEGRVPNITPGAAELGSWSKRDLVYYLQSGFTPDFDTVGGSMVKVQENLSRLPADELAAIAAYLKAIPPVAARGD
jgi:mono/diheme cytochrome c family protein